MARRSVDQTPKPEEPLASDVHLQDAPANNTFLDPETTYTVLSLGYRWSLTLMLGYLCLASSLTANIYFPLISLLAEHYNTSIQGINITITLYVVFQGIAPSVFSPLSDTLGRRPVYLISYGVYAAASLGLALSGTSYVALLILRALQSIGGSACVSLAYASVADYTVPAARGKFLGPMMAATNIGPSIGPVIGGGAILATGNPKWAFWTLVIFGGSALALIVIFMRETNREIVGNGSIPAQGIWRSAMDVVVSKKGRGQDPATGGAEKTNLPGATPTSKPTGRGRLTFPNPLSSLRLLLYRDAVVILFLAALPYGTWYTITTSIPLIYGVEYGFNDLIVGVCYLAGGAGILLGGVIAGQMMDWNYKCVAQEEGLSVDTVAGDNLTQFPIEKARSRGSYAILLVSMGVFAGYGWVVERRVHPAVPLVMQFYLGAKCTVMLQVYSALLVDVFPGNAGTAGASNNICRCALTAVLVAAMQPFVDAVGRGWFFTFIGLLDGLGSLVGVFVLRRYVPRWRKQRLEQEDDAR